MDKRKHGGRQQTEERSATGPSFFYEDEVFRINKNGDPEFGMVTENWDMYSSSEDEDEMDMPDKVPHGFVAVTWLPKSKDEVVSERKVTFQLTLETFLSKLCNLFPGATQR